MRVPRPLAAVLVFTSLMTVALGVALLVVPLLVRQLADFAERLPGYCHDIQSFFVRSRNGMLHRLGEAPSLDRVCRIASPRAGSAGSSLGLESIVEGALKQLSAVPTIAVTAVGTVGIGYYWTLNRQRLVRVLSRLVPVARREAFLDFADCAESRVGAFVRGQIIVSTVVGVATCVAYRAMGLPNVLALSVMAAVLDSIPIAGPLIAVTPAVLSATAMGGQTVGLVLLFAGSLRIGADYWLIPRVMGKSVGTNALLLLVCFVALGELAGIRGAIVAVPFAAILQLAGERLVLGEADPVTRTRGRDSLGRLRYEASLLSMRVRKQLRLRLAEVSTPPRSPIYEEEVEALADGLELVAARLERPAREDVTLEDRR